jgi:prephenate dehydratase
MTDRLRLALLGPAGTNTEEAALLYAPEAELVLFPSVPAVVSAVETGMADEGIVAIENSLEGAVPGTVDLLIHETGLRIRREVVLPIEHFLAVRPGTKAGDIRAIYSHPQGLGQCRRFLERVYPKVELLASLSTAAAVQEVMQRDDHAAAAIANARAVALYGAEVLASEIQEASSNETRFLVLAPEDHPPTGDDKTSLCFIIAEDRPGGLVNVLTEFSQRGINLSKLESRPSKDGLGKYVFLVDADAHRLDPRLAEALAGLARKTSFLKMFGSYPRWGRAG